MNLFYVACNFSPNNLAFSVQRWMKHTPFRGITFQSAIQCISDYTTCRWVLVFMLLRYGHFFLGELTKFVLQLMHINTKSIHHFMSPSKLNLLSTAKLKQLECYRLSDVCCCRKGRRKR